MNPRQDIRTRIPAGAIAALAMLMTWLCFAAPAKAGFGLSEFDVFYADSNGAAETQAGAHPDSLTVSFDLNAKPGEKPGGVLLDEALKDLEVTQIAGLAGNPTAVPRCPAADFLIQEGTGPACPDAAAVGLAAVKKIVGETIDSVNSYAPVYNLEPSPGEPAKLGFWVFGVPVTIDVGVSPTPPYNVVGGPRNISQITEVLSSSLTIWGVPADHSHDGLRGHCLGLIPLKEDEEGNIIDEPPSLGECEAGIAEVPFLTMPRSCEGPLATAYEADSWKAPGVWVKGSVLTHDAFGNPRGISGCGKLDFGPKISAGPTSRAASSPSGLDFSLDVTQNEGLGNPDGLSDADIAKSVVTLPEGMTANPSSAEGLEVCSEAQLARETAFSAPGAGCPDAAKLGTVEVETPLLEDQVLRGSLYLAKPYENPFGTLIALYVVIQDPELGVFVKQPLKVEPDPSTGQLITTAEDMPPIPFSHFRLRFREGARSPLVTPPACGAYEVKALLYPSSGGAPLETSSAFQILTGSGESPCPAGGTPPFGPSFEAGSNNNEAGAFSPFYMRLTRRDGDQDLTKFSAKLPPGMVAKLAGTTQCPDAAIAQARSRTGQNGGAEEQASPSCPASSRIGRVAAGAGVGPILTYVPGSLYLAGPYKGAPLSVVAIVPALAGPFDAGTVVTQEALRIDPLTAEVEADGSSSDPIPHILKGIPLKVRDVRVYVDKPEFTLNPTSCEPSEVGASIWGGGANVFSSLDDSPLSLASRFQAADCAGLGFKPNLALELRGGTMRGGHPALRGVFRPRAGDANLKKLILRLPRSAFLDQAHIRTICTRVQFAAGGGNGAGCPAGAVYGHATAYTPILDEPLEGPVFLRSSNHNLPDFVAALHGTIDVEAVARIDSKKGGIRATFPLVPDAPLTKVVVRMQGGKKGLIVNSRNLCAKPSKASVRFEGQNGKTSSAKPVLRARCKGG